MPWRILLAVLVTFITPAVFAQVAPAVDVRGIPLSVGAGVSDYSLDYGPGRRMIGISGWADYDLFHGLGIEAEGTTIFADKPESLDRMRQDTIKGGAIYKFHPLFLGVRPYAKSLIGLGSIDFPSRDPNYTHDTYTVIAFGGGAEVRAWRKVFVRGDYEYQFWKDYHGPHTLNPNGFTVGATYYFRGVHRH